MALPTVDTVSTAAHAEKRISRCSTPVGTRDDAERMNPTPATDTSDTSRLSPKKAPTHDEPSQAMSERNEPAPSVHQKMVESSRRCQCGCCTTALARPASARMVTKPVT